VIEPFVVANPSELELLSDNDVYGIAPKAIVSELPAIAVGLTVYETSPRAYVPPGISVV
jgi:hypothetical protein